MRACERFLRVNGWASDYESVGNVLRYYRRKVQSEGTRLNACQILGAFCVFSGKGPDELVGLQPKDASDLVQGYVDSLAEKGRSITYVNTSLAFLNTFFKLNGFKDSRSLEVERHYQPSGFRKVSEYIPTSSEIYNMAFASGSTRNRALIFALYTSGLRNSTLRSVLYRDVKDELESKVETVKLRVYPEMKKIDVGACKGNIPYYSFISREAVKALQEYLAERKQAHGNLGEEEPLFASDSTNVPAETRSHTPLMKKSLEATVKRSAQKAGIKRWREVHPHCLRKAFESALRNARLDVKDQEFLMGHILPGTQDTYYDSTKEEDLRRKYAQVNFFPERVYSDENFRKRQILDTAKILGFSEDRIKKIEEALTKYENVDEALNEIKKLSLESHRTLDYSDESGNRGKSEVRIIQGEHKLIRFLNDGWVLVKELPEDKFILKRSFD